MYTYCLTDFSSLTKANQANNYMIKPAIRLIKYWNANKNYKAISSYELERKIVAYYSIDRCQDYDTKRYLLNGLKQLQSIPMFDFQRDRVVKAIIAVQEAINDESNY